MPFQGGVRAPVSQARRRSSHVTQLRRRRRAPAACAPASGHPARSSRPGGPGPRTGRRRSSRTSPGSSPRPPSTNALRRRQVQARARAPPTTSTTVDVEAVEDLTHVRDRLVRRAVRGEAVVHRDHALVGYDVAGHSARGCRPPAGPRGSAARRRRARAARTRAAARAPAPAAWIALSPIHARALWARRPGTRTSTRSVPWQPPSTSAPVGSMSTARSPSSSSGRVSASRRSPLKRASTSSAS